MADNVLAETAQGLWLTLLRLVPAKRREEASALANVLQHFAERIGYQDGRLAERRAQEERERLAAAHLRDLPCPSDAPRTWKDDARKIRVLDTPDTPH